MEATSCIVKETECRACGKDYLDPKILPCGHLLCRDCIASMLTSAADAPCPFCGSPILPPEVIQGQSAAATADALPTDMAMVALVDSMHVLEQEQVCCACESAAALLCLNCLDLLCVACANVHRKLSSTRYHVVEDVTALTAEGLASRRPVLCSKHGDRRADLFCSSHGLALCGACVLTEHQSCPGFCKMDDAMKAADVSLSCLRDRLDAAIKELDESLTYLDACLDEADAREQAAVLQVDTFCSRVHELVEDCRNSTKESFQNPLSNVKDALLGEKSSLAAQRRKLKAHRQLVERARKRAPGHSLQDVEASLRKRVDSLDFACKMSADQKMASLPKLRIDESVMAQLERLLTKLGRLEDDHQEAVLVFHENRGTSIRLTNNRMTAERVGAEETFGNGVVVSRDPMATNVLYEVRVDQIGDFHWNTLTLGVTGTPPAHLRVTTWSEDLEDSVIIRYSGVSRMGRIFKVNFGKALKKLEVGSRVGVLVGASRDLRLFVDGHDQGVAAEKVPQPCFAIFDVCNKITQVTALPMSKWM